MKTVGIIGGLDFIGCDITLKFLSENYKVKVVKAPGYARRNPLIKTGLKAGGNLSVYQFDLKDEFLLDNFLKDCDCLIHCGLPYRLQMNEFSEAVYIPLIFRTQFLLKAVERAHALKTIVFLTSVAVLAHFKIGYGSSIQESKNENFKYLNHLSEHAYKHSGKIMNGNLNHISDKQIKIIVVSPVVVDGNYLSNNNLLTREALQFIFTHKLDHDGFFRMLAGRYLLETMVNVDELPDKVFKSTHSADYL